MFSLAKAYNAAPTFALSNVFGDSMVLQRDRPVTVYGFGTPGSTVYAQAGSPSVSCQVGDDTVWRCVLPATPAGGPFNLTFTSDGQTASLNDVLFGDVYFIGGQSNAVFSVCAALNASAEIADATVANYPFLRIFTAGQHTRGLGNFSQLSAITQPWTQVSPSAVGSDHADNVTICGFDYFSAVGWFFGRSLYKLLDGSVPIGLASVNWGGTVLQEWSDPAIVTNASCPQAESPIPHVEALPGDLWDPMVTPYTLGPFDFKAVVWYQVRESHALVGQFNVASYQMHVSTIASVPAFFLLLPFHPHTRAQAESNIDITGPGFGGAYYACQFPLTIASWRKAFGSPQLPWLFVQLAAYTAKSGDSPNTLPDMRQGQLDGGLSLPNVSFVTAMDLGDIGSPFTDIHPRRKQPVGARLAAVAAAELYGMGGLTHRGPMYESAIVVDSGKQGYASVAVTFTADSLPGDAVVVVDQTMGQACPPSYNYTQ